MKNFLRALRYSWPYRGRLLASVVCAAVAALLWGLTFTAVSPVLTILVHKQNLQEWAEAKIKETRKRIDELQDKREGIVQEVDRLNNLEPGSIRDKLLRDRTRNVA